MTDNSQYKKSLKSSDTEEWFDLIFYRKIGYGWAVIAKKLGISPNAITIASIFLGIASGICFYYNSFLINCLAVLLLIWANSFDSADGQLARMTQQYSRLGRILDGVSSDLWFIAIYIAICLRENTTSEFFISHSWAIWVIAVVAGASHAIQAAMADHYRQFHLHFLRGKELSELDSASELRKRYNKLSWSKNFFNKLILYFYTTYTEMQERCTPNMQQLRKKLVEKYGDMPSEDFRNKFREKSLPLMKYTNILSFNTRSFALFASVLIFRMPWLYFAFEITVMNVILIYMVCRHEKICRQLELAN